MVMAKKLKSRAKYAKRWNAGPRAIAGGQSALLDIRLKAVEILLNGARITFKPFN